MFLPHLSIQPSSVSGIDLQNSDGERSEAIVKTSTKTVHVVMNVVFERSGSPIIVLVNYVRGPAGYTGRRDHLKIGVSGFDRIVELAKRAS
jgi:hypothetical protein